MIEVENLTKRYGEKLAVDGLDFVVRPGVVTGFLGPNGAGKSTTMRMIAGLDEPSAGRVRVNGRGYRGAPAWPACPRALAWLTDPAAALAACAVSMSVNAKELAVPDAGRDHDGDGGQRRPDDQARFAGQAHPAGHGAARRVREYRRSRGDRVGDAIFSVLARAGVGPVHLLTTRRPNTGRPPTTPPLL